MSRVLSAAWEGEAADTTCAWLLTCDRRLWPEGFKICFDSATSTDERPRRTCAAQHMKHRSTALHALDKHAIMTSTSLLTQLADLLSHNTISREQYAALTAQHQKEVVEASQAIIAGSNVLLRLQPDALDAAAHVFNTAELLENILSYVSECDLRSKVLLVCRGFRDTVRTSLLLRRKLFLAPDRKCSEIHHSEASRAQEVPCVVNTEGCHTTSGKCACTPPCAPSLVINFSDTVAPGCQPNGFRRLLISQPPVTRLSAVYVHFITGSPRVDLVPAVHDPKGVTFGHLMDHLAEMLSGELLAHFGYQYVGYWDPESCSEGA